MVKIFKAAIGKKNKSWYVENILDLTLGKQTLIEKSVLKVPFII